MDWWMDILTICIHQSEQVITAPPLITTIHKSPQHPLSLLQPVVSSPAVPWQRLLTVEILKHHAPRFNLHSLPYRTLLNPKSKLCYDRQSVVQSVSEKEAHLGLNTRSLLLYDKLQACWCRTLSLTRGQVCRLPESQSAVIRLLSVCTICILQVIKCMYVQHIQGLCQSRLSTADHALSLLAPAITAV
jgi:hypothetical protein